MGISKKLRKIQEKLLTQKVDSGKVNVLPAEGRRRTLKTIQERETQNHAEAELEPRGDLRGWGSGSRTRDRKKYSNSCE